MIQYRCLGVVLAGLLGLLAAREVWAGAPTDQLKGAIDRVIKALDEPELKEPGKTQKQRVVVRRIANDIFDFTETAKRALARHWQTRTGKEREEFIVLFGDLLERSYLSKIELYGGEKIQYVGESVDSDVATVRTKLVTRQGTEVPVDYRMHKRADRWLVYDFSVEGVSLINNYRTQFNKIIQTSSYTELVKKMKTKQDEFLAEEQSKGKDAAKKQ